MAEMAEVKAGMERRQKREKRKKLEQKKKARVRAAQAVLGLSFAMHLRCFCHCVCDATNTESSTASAQRCNTDYRHESSGQPHAQMAGPNDAAAKLYAVDLILSHEQHTYNRHCMMHKLAG